MAELGWQAWATVAIVVAMLAALVREVARADMVLAGCAAALVGLGILTPQDAFAGFSNGAVIAVGALFVVAAGVQNTGALAFADRLLFPRRPNARQAALQISAVVAPLSAFLNNTPLVAMFMPRVQAWAERSGVAPSKLMIPLSYAAIVGGGVTLIGTSTNLVVAGLMEEAGVEPLKMFTLTPVGLPAAVAGLVAMLLFGLRWLPERGGAGGAIATGLARCLFEVRVAAGGPLDGRTVEEAGLRALGTAFLVHLSRDGAVIPAAPETGLRGGDLLLFQGDVDALDGLLDRPGLERTTRAVEEPREASLPLFEAVVAQGSPLVGKTLRGVDFRERYGGVVLAVQRRDDAVFTGLGQTPLESGDLLVVEAPAGFHQRLNADRGTFSLVAPRRALRPRAQKGRAPLALAVLLAVVGVAAFDLAPIEATALVGAVVMVLTGCLSGREARRSVDYPTLVVIAFSLAVGKALETTGMAAALADTLVALFGGAGPIGVVAAVYLSTVVLTEFISNNAAAAIMVAIGLRTAAGMGVPPDALCVTVALGASAGFLNPLGYQTHLMVMSAGGYRFSDFARAGLPVTLAFGAVALTMVYLVWL